MSLYTNKVTKNFLTLKYTILDMHLNYFDEWNRKTKSRKILRPDSAKGDPDIELKNFNINVFRSIYIINNIKEI